jgi:hypothetical protein
VAGVTPEDVLVVELLATPCSAAEFVALRVGRFVPLFGRGPNRAEARRALSFAGYAFGQHPDPRAMDHTLAMLLHPGIGCAPLREVASAVKQGALPQWTTSLCLGLASALGAGDGLRETIAESVENVAALGTEIALARFTGGGELSTWRGHYQQLRAAVATDPSPRALNVARHWFDFVLARRWSGLDGLRSLLNAGTLDLPSQWLCATADWIAGEERARARLTDLAEGMLEPLKNSLPHVAQIVAREMVELLAHPWSTRWEHLRCMVARDHASVAVRSWLHAAAEESFFEDSTPEGVRDFSGLGPEPTQAGKAASEARQLAGDFLLDWYVQEREPRIAVDDWARRALKVYHRLRGAVLLDIALTGARADGLTLHGGELREGVSL